MNYALDDPVQEFAKTFFGILWEAMPFIILGALIAGLLEELVPQSLVARLLPRRRLLAILLSGLLGLIFPMCECGIIPVMRRLMRKGVPLSCCICYMLAGPIINVVVMMSTFVAFSNMEMRSTDRQFGALTMTGLRVGMGYLVAVLTSLVVEWQYRKHGVKLLAPLAMPDLKGDTKEEERTGPRPSIFGRIGNISETAVHDFIDIMVFLILGALLSAGTRLLIRTSGFDVVQFSHHYPGVVVLIMMLLAIVLCLCSEADAFVAASFKEVPAAAKLGFLVLGPMLDFKLYLMFTRVFRPRLMWTIIFCVFVQVFIFANLMNLVVHNVPQGWFDQMTATERHIQSIFGSAKS